jgi:hemolysin activation/secretion protein
MKHPYSCFGIQPLILSTLTLSVLLSMTAIAAPIAPDAGQVIRELQLQPELNLPKPATSSVQPEAQPATTPPSATSSEIIEIKAIHVSGSTVFAANELENLVANLIGGTHTLAELSEGASRITAYYRQRGYLLASAYLPAQDIKEGVLSIAVMEGLLGEQRITNQSRISDDRIHYYLKAIKNGAALQAKQVDRALLLLNDTPGIGATRASLQPGASVGTTDLLIEIDPAKLYSANLELDNYGNRYTGEYRLGGALALHNPLKIGDQLSLRALTSNKNMTYVRLAYQLPIGGNGLKLGGAYADTRYRLVKEFADLKAHGSASSASVYATYPFIRSPSTSLSGTLTWEAKGLVDQMDAVSSKVDKHVRLVNAGLAGNHQDALWGAGITSFDTSLVVGQLDMDAASLANDAASAQSKGDFAKLSYNLNRLQRLNEKNTLSLALLGQHASKNLNSSEKFSLGGANGVRAYPQGEGSGDQGWMTNLEVRHSFMEKLQGVVFYDAGSVTLNHNSYSTTPNMRNIAGAGFGMTAQYKSMNFKLSAAWPTGGGASQSEPTATNSSPRVWVQVAGQY